MERIRYLSHWRGACPIGDNRFHHEKPFSSSLCKVRVCRNVCCRSDA
jgi:hypothetical protein